MCLDKAANAASFSILTWNIEGAKHGCHTLTHFANTYKPLLIFLSEPQLLHCDAESTLSSLTPQYSFHLNNEESIDPDLPLHSPKTWGGTMVLWHKKVDPFVTVLPTTSPAFLPILLSIPGLSASLHISIYLPTRGREELFTLTIIQLVSLVTSLKTDYPDIPIYIRGDSNINPKHSSRMATFASLMGSLSILSLVFGSLPMETEPSGG